MAIRIVNRVPGVGDIEMAADASITYTTGSIVYRDTSTGEVKEQTATAGDATTVEGITTKTETTGSSAPYIRVAPIHSGMYVVADCTASTAADQLNKAHLYTDARTVNNTDTHSTDINATFIALKIVGATTDKKLFGYIAKLGQVTA